MRIFGILISICIPLTTPCWAQEGSRYIRDAGPGSPVIIFLHGVLGDSTSTWSKGNVYWPDLLTRDNAFSGTSIYVHEYKTELLRNGFSSLSIGELATELNVQLVAARVMQRGQLVFIAHSMGGLVVRHFLLKNRNMAEKTRFIFFLSTPTTGAAIGNWAAAVSRNPQFKQMKPMVSDSYLADMQRDWLDAGFGTRIASYCAYEKEPTYFMLVVDQASASNLCNKMLIPVQANHIDIAKPAGPNAIQYMAFQVAFNNENETLASKFALVDRGRSYLATKDYDRAVADFNEAVRLDAEYVPALKNRAAAYYERREYGQAIADYDKAIHLEPEYAEHFYNRAGAYLATQDYNRAIADFTKALDLNFYYKAGALYYRGVAKQNNGDRAGGEADTIEARKIDPNVGK
jgi:tetratricopeptide (TPR) repeat protein